MLYSRETKIEFLGGGVGCLASKIFMVSFQDLKNNIFRKVCFYG